jgi:hypothetical protein
MRKRDKEIARGLAFVLHNVGSFNWQQTLTLIGGTGLESNAKDVALMQCWCKMV